MDPVRQNADGSILVILNEIPEAAWPAINNYMVEHGYDWRGPEDAKAVFTRLLRKMNGTLNPKHFKDHVDALKYALGFKMTAWKPKPFTPGLTQKLINTFGLTNNLAEAGYILPNGALLDFSGKHEGGLPGRRVRSSKQKY